MQSLKMLPTSHLFQPGPSVDGRADRAKVALDLRGGDGCLGGLDLRGVDGDTWSTAVSRSCGATTFFVERYRGALVVDFIEVERFAALLTIALGLVERGLVRTRVDGEKQVALFHVRAVGEMTFGDLPGHLRLD